MKPQVRRLRLHKSTLREVTSDLALGVMGGSVTFTGNTCAPQNTCNTCQTNYKCTAGTCAACPTWECLTEEGC